MILKSMEVKMEYKKIVKLLSVIIFSLIMSNSVLGADADTHKKLMERHRSALKDSQAALKEHREKFPHLQEQAEEVYGLHRRTVEDLIAQILVEKHGENHVPTPTQITLATIAAHIKASQAPSIPFLGIKGKMADLFNALPEAQDTNDEDQAVDYSDLPPAEHSPEPIIDQTQEYLKKLAKDYNQENVPYDNQTLKEFVRRTFINPYPELLNDFYKKEVERMQDAGVNQNFIDRFKKDMAALLNQIGTGQVVPGMALRPMQAVPAQGVSRSSSEASSMELDPLNGQRYSQTPVESQGSREATSVYMSDEDGENSSVPFDGNRGSSFASSSTELHTPDSEVYFSPIPGENQESSVVSPAQGVTRSSSEASQSEQSDSRDGNQSPDLVPSSDSDSDDSDNEDDEEETDFAAKNIVASIPKNYLTEQQQIIFLNKVYEEFLKQPAYVEVKKEITKAHQDALNLIREKFRKQQ